MNTELFEQNGVDIPETYDEFLTAVDAFSAAGITPIALGEKDLWPGLMIYGFHAIRMAGAENFNAALICEASYNTPELIEAARLVQDLAKRGGFGNSALGTSQDDAVAAIKQGKAAMMFMGSWLNGDCEFNCGQCDAGTVLREFTNNKRIVHRILKYGIKYIRGNS